MVLIGLLVIPARTRPSRPRDCATHASLLAYVPLNLLTLALMGFLNGLQHFKHSTHCGRWLSSAAAAVVVLATLGSLTPTTARSRISANAITLVAAVLLVAIGELHLAVAATAKDLLSFGLKSQLSSVSRCSTSGSISS